MDFVARPARRYTFKLKQDVKFQRRRAVLSKDVKFTFERAKAEESTNKDKRPSSTNRAIETPDPYGDVVLKQAERDFLFRMGWTPP